jgi:hypothetical protein
MPVLRRQGAMRAWQMTLKWRKRAWHSPGGRSSFLYGYRYFRKIARFQGY